VCGKRLLNARLLVGRLFARVAAGALGRDPNVDERRAK
jgi:hypothetical protein